MKRICNIRNYKKSYYEILNVDKNATGYNNNNINCYNNNNVSRRITNNATIMVRTILALQMHFCNQIRRGCKPRKLVQLRPQLLYRHLPTKQVSVHRSVTNIICIQDQASLVSIDLTICTMEQAKKKSTIARGKNNFIYH